MKPTILVALVFSLLAPLSWAAVSEQTATGIAEDYNQALSAALYNAVQQENGAKLTKTQTLKADIEQLINSSAGTSTSTTSIDIGTQEKITATGTKFIKSYQVTQVKKPSKDKKTWEVTVKAEIPKYESLVDSADRPSIAVMPFRFTHPTFQLSDTQASSNSFQLSGRIKDKLISALTQTQYFTVLNRADDAALSAEFLTESALLNSDFVSATEASRFGNIVGADFMITGRINDLVSQSEVKSFYGMDKKTTVDLIDISFQVVEVATQKLLWADTITTEYDRPKDAPANATIDYVAKLVSSSTLDHLHPIKVLKAKSESQIYLNQGRARISKGDIYAIHSKGETFADPSTGLEIATEGEEVARIEVASTHDKYAIGTLTSGDFSAVKEGNALMPVNDEPKADDKQVRETPGSSDAPVKWN